MGKTIRLIPTECKIRQIQLVRRRKSSPLLCLPNELVFKIIRMVPLWHHNRIRGVCRQLQMLTDANVMHDVQCRLTGSTSISSYEVAVQEVFASVAIIYIYIYI